MNRYFKQIPYEAAVGGDGAGGGGSGGDGAAAAAAGGGDAAAAAAAAKLAAAGGDGAGGGGAAAKTFYDGLYDKEGKIDKTALDRLPDHLKSYKDVYAKYPTIDALMNGLGNAHNLGIKKALTPLPADAPAEVVAERKAHLDQINNVPKEAKGYGIARPQDLPEMFWQQDGADKFAALAHKHSISPAAVKEILDLQTGMVRADIARGQAMDTEFYQKQDQNFADAIKKQNLAPERADDLIKRGAQTLGIDPASKVLKNAEVKLAVLRAAQLVSEEKLIGGEPSGGSGAVSFRDQARDIMSNPQNPLHKAWNDPSDPRNQEARERVNALYRSHKGS